MNSTTVSTGTCIRCGDDTQYDIDDLVTVVRRYRVSNSREEALADMHRYYEQMRLRISANPEDDYIAGIVERYDSSTDEERERRAITNHLMTRIEEVSETVCTDHVMMCEWCEEPYIDTIYDERWNWHRATFGSCGLLDWHHDDTLCETCSDGATQCRECNELVRSDDSYYLDYNDSYYCEDCYYEHSHECESCGERVTSYHDEDDCYEENGAGQLVHNYSYKPKPTFFDVDRVSSQPYDNHTPYMGVELEVEIEGSYTDAAMRVSDSLGTHAYLKQDGSISRGFEIVTHPHTLAAYETAFSWSFLDYLSNNGGSSWRTDTCGLHVHISRAAFSSLVHQALFTHLIQSNEQQMSRLAGRKSNWAKFGEGDAPVHEKVKQGQARDRYQAVNMLNLETVEVRIFRGSLMKRRVLMALELVEACYQYTKLMTSNDFIRGNMAWNAFAKWVHGRKEYENLNYYIRLYKLYDNHTAPTTTN